MGAKAWLLVYSNGNVAADLRENTVLDRERTVDVAAALFPRHRLVDHETTDLYAVDPRGNTIHIGCYGDTTIVCAEGFGIDYPSRLDRHFIEAPFGESAYLLATHSVVDWFAFAIWKEGRLERSFSASPESGVLEDLGAPIDCEVPFRGGDRPAVDPAGDDTYPLDFHPLDLCEAVFNELCGFVLEGEVKPEHIAPEKYVLLKHRRKWRWLPF